MQVGCYQKGNNLEDTVSTFYTAASCRQCRHTWIVRAAETETEEDMDVEEEAVSRMCAGPISSQWQACCTSTQSFCCFSFQICSVCLALAGAWQQAMSSNPTLESSHCHQESSMAASGSCAS